MTGVGETPGRPRPGGDAATLCVEVDEGQHGVTMSVMSGLTEYEYRVLTFDRHTSKAEARQAVREHAEYGRWELSRSVIYVGGIRRMWLRRKIMRVQRT